MNASVIDMKRVLIVCALALIATHKVAGQNVQQPKPSVQNSKAEQADEETISFEAALVNTRVSVRDAQGHFVQFDAPITFTYVLASGDDRNGNDSLAGQTYYLSYGGAGQLWGLPQQGVDLDADGDPDRWYPVVNLADGIVLGPTGTEYVIKALEIEQTLAPDAAYAGPLDLANANTLVVPGVSLYTQPAIGPAPVINDPPRVVQGVVVGP